MTDIVGNFQKPFSMCVISIRAVFGEINFSLCITVQQHYNEQCTIGYKDQRPLSEKAFIWLLFNYIFFFPLQIILSVHV